jgi:hypothetical protein
MNFFLVKTAHDKDTWQVHALIDFTHRILNCKDFFSLVNFIGETVCDKDTQQVQTLCQVQCLWVSPEPTQVKHHSNDPLYARFLASSTNISLRWKNLPGTNTLAYYENS